VVVPQSEGLSGWQLSPAGDKIAYTSHIDEVIKSVLLFPATQTRHDLGTCKGFTWLDSQTLFCSLNNRLVATLDDENVTTIPLTKVRSSEVNLSELLQSAEKIYHFERPSLAQTLLLQDTTYPPDPNKNYLIEGVDMDNVLQSYPVITIPKPLPVGGPEKEIHSPDGKYYYNLVEVDWDQYALSIHETNNNKLLSEFVGPEIHYFIVGGWAADSSGVYFEIATTALSAEVEKLEQILKLKVPE